MMTVRLAATLTRITLIVLILDSLYLLFMFLVFPLLRAKGFSAFFAEAAQGFGVGQRGFTIHWVVGLIAIVAVLVCAAGYFKQLACSPALLVTACAFMIAFTVGSGLYLRGHLGARHAWRIGICLLSIGLVLSAKVNSEEKEEPNQQVEGIRR